MRVKRYLYSYKFSRLLIFVLAPAFFLSCKREPSYLAELANTLKQVNVCSDKYSELQQQIENGNIQNGLDILKYCDHATVVDVKNYDPNIEKSLEKAHRDISQVYPGLDFKNFSHQIVLDTILTDKETEFYDFIVFLEVDGKKCQNRFFYRLFDKVKKNYTGGDDFDPEIVDIFNKVLADKRSEYRIRVVDHAERNVHDGTKFGVIAVTKEQSKAIHTKGFQIIDLRYGSFSNSISNQSILNLIEEYKKAGVLNHLSGKQIEMSTKAALTEDVRIVNGILYYFPNTVHVFDMELSNLEHPYAELVNKYRDISHGEFSPTDVSDDFRLVQKGTTRLKFTLNNKVVVGNFKVEGDWMDPKYFDFIDSVTVSNNLKGKFYWLYTGGQEACIIYLTPIQHEVLKAKKALYFGEDHEPNEDE